MNGSRHRACREGNWRWSSLWSFQGGSSDGTTLRPSTEVRASTVGSLFMSEYYLAFLVLAQAVVHKCMSCATRGLTATAPGVVYGCQPAYDEALEKESDGSGRGALRGRRARCQSGVRTLCSPAPGSGTAPRRSFRPLARPHLLGVPLGGKGTVPSTARGRNQLLGGLSDRRKGAAAAPLGPRARPRGMRRHRLCNGSPSP